jgi:phage repressor protein C with HTH and peptisase S24 domain
MARPPKPQRSLTHAQIWTALDRLAERAGLSPSALARRAGLDPTTFNKSKLITADGRERWPSTESVAKAITAAGQSIDAFVLLIGDGGKLAPSVPLLALAHAADGAHFDDGGLPTGRSWEEMPLPAGDDGRAFALEISGDALAPAYRGGDIIMVSPSTPIRRGDRVAVKTREGAVMVSELKRRTARTLELRAIHAPHADQTLATSDVARIARIVWVRQ